jgi:hypothetical protein
MHAARAAPEAADVAPVAMGAAHAVSGAVAAVSGAVEVAAGALASLALAGTEARVPGARARMADPDAAPVNVTSAQPVRGRRVRAGGVAERGGAVGICAQGQGGERDDYDEAQPGHMLASARPTRSMSPGKQSCTAFRPAGQAP